MGHGGKGDTPRPISVDQNTFASNWEAIFGKKKKEVVDTQQLEHFFLTGGRHCVTFPPDCLNIYIRG
jgi:hypothetical protein